MRWRLLLGFLLLGQGLTEATDWPHYLGPNGDCSTSETVRTNWQASPPQVKWRVPIGPGFSCVAANRGKLFTLARKKVSSGDREVCIALDPDSGKKIWETDLDVADYTNLSGYDDNMDGPRSTPTVEGNRVYAFTSHLRLYSLDTESGQVLWKRDFPAEFGSSVISWENAASPLVVGDLIFVNSNASRKCLMAIRKSDGTTAWSGQDDEMTHASPIRATIGGVPQVIFLTHSGLVSVVPETGVVLWRLAFSPSSTSTAASPAVVGDYVYASAAYGSGTWMAHVINSAGKWSATQAWRQQGNSYQAHWTTPVAHEGYLYCVPSPSGGPWRLSCLDPVAGANKWTQVTVGSGPIGYGSLIKASNTLIVLTESGELVLVKPDPTAYIEIARLKVLNQYCWNHPVLANGRLYARSTSLSPELVALDVGDSVSPLPKLQVSATPIAPGSNRLRLTVRSLDGTLLDPIQLNRLELRTTPVITKPSSEWSVHDQPFTVSNGEFVTEFPLGSENAEFLRIQEKASSP